MKTQAKYWIELVDGPNGPFFRFVARNGQKSMTSEIYSSKRSRDRSAAAISREFSIEVRKGKP